MKLDLNHGRKNKIIKKRTAGLTYTMLFLINKYLTKWKNKKIRISQLTNVEGVWNKGRVKTKLNDKLTSNSHLSLTLTINVTKHWCWFWSGLV